MSYLEKLKKTQNIAYQTLKNSFSTNHTSHAYLLQGGPSVHLLDIAHFVAKSFICNSPIEGLACETCPNCIRIEDHAYPDFIVVDGEKTSIKKQDIEDIQIEFNKTSFEENGKKIYILNMFENATTGASNSLLKFLEEPVEDVIAIITTRNISKILPTIISRCQVIRLKEISKAELYENLLTKYDQETSYILSNLFPTLEEIENYLKSDEEDLHAIIDYVFETLDCLAYKKDVHYYLMTDVYKNINNKNQAKIFLDICCIFLKDVLSSEGSTPTHFADKGALSSLLKESKFNLNDVIKEMMIARGNIDVNANIPLLLDSLFYNLLKGVN